MNNSTVLILTTLISFVISASLGIVLIPFLHKIHFGQTILDIGPAWHKKKQGTPIMGGFMFIISIPIRSEERRVGKECRSRWSPYH